MYVNLLKSSPLREEKVYRLPRKTSNVLRSKPQLADAEVIHSGSNPSALRQTPRTLESKKYAQPVAYTTASPSLDPEEKWVKDSVTYNPPTKLRWVPPSNTGGTTDDDVSTVYELLPKSGPIVLRTSRSVLSSAPRRSTRTLYETSPSPIPAYPSFYHDVIDTTRVSSPEAAVPASLTTNYDASDLHASGEVIDFNYPSRFYYDPLEFGSVRSGSRRRQRMTPPSSLSRSRDLLPTKNSSTCASPPIRVSYSMVRLFADEAERRTAIVYDENVTFCQMQNILAVLWRMDEIREAAFTLFAFQRDARAALMKQEDSERRILLQWHTQCCRDAVEPLLEYGTSSKSLRRESPLPLPERLPVRTRGKVPELPSHALSLSVSSRSRSVRSEHPQTSRAKSSSTPLLRTVSPNASPTSPRTPSPRSPAGNRNQERSNLLNSFLSNTPLRGDLSSENSGSTDGEESSTTSDYSASSSSETTENDIVTEMSDGSITIDAFGFWHLCGRNEFSHKDSTEVALELHSRILRQQELMRTDS